MIIVTGDEIENYNNSRSVSVTIGKFDGIHLGHRALIDETIRCAKYSNMLSCVITFNNTADISEESNPCVLTTLKEKKYLLEQIGVDVMVVLEFTDVLKNMSPDDFINFFLADMLNTGAVTIGSDFRFGKDKKGGIEDFEKAQMVYGFDLTVMDKEKADDLEISSTRIRELIKNGDLKKANELLGYDYLIAGITESGKRKGRKMGMPTINLYPRKDKLIPPLGVYASKAVIDGKVYNAVTNIGVCPTITDNREISVETHLLDYSSDKDIYGEFFAVHLHDFIREETKFDSVEALSTQIEDDIKEAVKLLAQ